MQNKSQRAIVFDLDDTLYLERNFARSGFKAADIWLQSETGLDGLYEVCIRLFEQGSRGKVFDDALRELAPQQSPALVDRLVRVYRQHAPEITLEEDAKRCLERHASRSRLGLITDGLAATQWAKIRSLNIAQFFDFIVCTDDWGREYWKPHPRSFEFMEKQLCASGSDLVYVADNPAKDFVTPKARGWYTVQLARKLRIHKNPSTTQDFRAHCEIETLDRLDSILQTFRTDC